VHDEELREVWRAHECEVPISTALCLVREGLVLGAGTVIVAADGERRLRSPRVDEGRVLALLSAAYGRAVAPSVLGNIERAAKAWCEGDDRLAYIHLAHAGLQPLDNVRAGAYRLFLADCAMKHCASHRAVLEALHLDARYIDAVEKLYNPNEPRVPAGSGRTSGEWTDGEETSGDVAATQGAAGEGEQGSSLLGRMPLPAASFLGELDASQIAELSAYASRLLGPGVAAAVAMFGLLFIPSPNNIKVEGEVPEIPGLRYSWNRDETLLRLTYDDPEGGQHTFFAQLDGDVVRDVKGRVIGRVLSGRNVAIDAAAVSPDLVDEDEPRLCPVPVKDRRTNKMGLEYENYIKSIVNPENPTLPYMGYKLPNAVRVVSFDDCEHSTGTMVEIKDGYAGFLEDDWGRAFLKEMFLKQAMDQVQAAGTRPVRWYFSQGQVADYAKKYLAKSMV
jgi:hypothetical protein